MSAAFDRDALLDAFDRIARAAVDAGTKLQIAVYGGSALMLASNFRFATEDVDIREIRIDSPRLVVGRCAGTRRPDALARAVLRRGSTMRLRFFTSGKSHREQCRLYHTSRQGLKRVFRFIRTARYMRR